MRCCLPVKLITCLIRATARFHPGPASVRWTPCPPPQQTTGVAVVLGLVLLQILLLLQRVLLWLLRPRPRLYQRARLLCMHTPVWTTVIPAQVRLLWLGAASPASPRCIPLSLRRSWTRTLRLSPWTARRTAGGAAGRPAPPTPTTPSKACPPPPAAPGTTAPTGTPSPSPCPTRTYPATNNRHPSPHP